MAVSHRATSLQVLSGWHLPLLPSPKGLGPRCLRHLHLPRSTPPSSARFHVSTLVFFVFFSEDFGCEQGPQQPLNHRRVPRTRQGSQHAREHTDSDTSPLPRSPESLPGSCRDGRPSCGHSCSRAPRKTPVWAAARSHSRFRVQKKKEWERDFRSALTARCCWRCRDPPRCRWAAA